MSESTTQGASNRQRLPRYPGEEPLQRRTPGNDEAALNMAKLALQAKYRLRQKRIEKSEEVGEGATAKKQEEAKHDNIEKDRPSPVVDVETTTGTGNHAETKHEDLKTIEEYIDDLIPWPAMPSAWADDPDTRLPLKSMYEGSGEWPKRTVQGSKQYSWSNIGHPRDNSLIVPDFEEGTHIDSEEASIMDLAKDVNNIRSMPPHEIADGTVNCLQENNRTIETFKVHGRTVSRVKFSDVDVFGEGSPYSASKVSRALERKINKDFGAQPDLQIERWVTTHVLLCKAGQIGGRTDQYWKEARSLAQQQLYLNPDLENKVRQQMEAGGHDKDPAFFKMLEIVKEGCPTKVFNPYHQAKRNDYATDNKLLYNIQNTDIVLVLDQSDNIILFQCSDVFKQLLTKAIQKLVVQSFETYSSRTPVPFPDMTRHGLHWIAFLRERPDLDFRNPNNDPRLAKSGVFHIGGRCEVGDPNGRNMPAPTKDSAGKRVPEQGNVLHQLVKLRYSAFGACTEIINFFFQILEPGLLQQYIRVANEVSKLDTVPFQTRRSDEPFMMRALLVNLMTYEHKDTGDWHRGYAFLVPVGDFSGGDLVVRELGLQIEAPSGCLQMFRGRELRHSITKWTGRRFVCVTVTHEAVRRWALRSLGEDFTESRTTSLPSVMADCIDQEPEDVVPEYQRSEKELLPEVFVDEEELDMSPSRESEASLPPKSALQARSKSNLKTDSTSDASAEASEEAVPVVKGRKKD
ncbi:hypothetical protein J7T55_011290 [Diaporthe amygdali]|uniref:uncharacterized protein n=1 Tax=Phomopsis amygdali TaxID=1214568 RepID=UPI0022FE88F6|nr:uncharacterized protein J7T55_011290 [Diaporthe amygdali]KAJ0108799.1 hypothetical protein J7T55_011290 [Diaporthe amygdali]